MADSEEKISSIGVIAGFLFLFFIVYIVYILLIVPYNIQIYFYVFIALLIVFIGFIIYFCIKKPDFRQRTAFFLKKIFASISRIGENVIENLSREERKSKKKKRVQIPNKIKNAVYERASYKCQLCNEDVGLDIHHINGNPSNNSLNNLILLCATHHKKAQMGGIKKEQLKSALKKQTRTGKITYVSK